MNDTTICARCGNDNPPDTTCSQCGGYGMVHGYEGDPKECPRCGCSGMEWPPRCRKCGAFRSLKEAA